MLRHNSTLNHINKIYDNLLFSKQLMNSVLEKSFLMNSVLEKSPLMNSVLEKSPLMNSVLEKSHSGKVNFMIFLKGSLKKKSFLI